MKSYRKGLVTLALLPFISACGGSSETATPTTAPAGTETPTTTAAAAAPAGASAPIPVDATIVDPEREHTFKATSVVRNFPVPAQAASRGERAELVLVKLDVTAGEKYFTIASPSALRLIGSTGTAATSVSNVEAEMAAAGYPVLDDVKRGETGSGWAAFFVEPKNSETLTLRLVRSAFGVSGSDETIPRKEFDVPLL